MIVTNLVLFFALFQAYKMVRRMIITRAESVAFENADQIIRIEKGLHLYIELPLQRWVLEQGSLIRFFNYHYAWFMWLFYAAAALAMLGRPHVYKRWRAVFFASMLIALPWFAIYPLAPPRFMTDLGFIDTLALYGPNYFSEGGIVTANRFAAMPSMHIGWTTIGSCMLAAAFPRHRIGAIIGIAHITLMSFTVMVTGNHWVLDLVGGWLVFLASVGGVALLARRISLR